MSFSQNILAVFKIFNRKKTIKMKLKISKQIFFFIDKIQKRKMQKIWAKILLLFNIFDIFQANLFCNSDFQGYTTAIYFLDPNFKYSLWYGLFVSDQCWKSKGNMLFQVKSVSFFNNNKFLSLGAFTNTKVCQNFDLTLNSYYNYSFDIGLNPFTLNSTIYVEINNVIVQAIQKVQTNSITSHYGRFLANTTANQFCVWAQNNKSTYSNTDDFDSLVDNFNLIVDIVNTMNTSNTNASTNSNISNFTSNTSNITSNSTSNTSNSISNSTSNNTFNSNITSNITSNNSSSNNFSNLQNKKLIFIHFRVTGIDKLSIINLQSIQIIQPYILAYVVGNGKLSIGGEIQNSFDFQLDSKGFIKGHILVNKVYNLDSIRCQFTNNSQSPFIVKIQFQNTQSLIYPATQQQRRNLQMIQNFSNNTLTFLLSSINMFQMVSCSYFVSNFISFFNIIVLYNFLNVRTQPSDSYRFIKSVAELFFNSNSNVLKFFNQTLGKLNITFNPNFSDFVETEVNERVPKTLNNFQWFNNIGITYNFLQNNLSDIIQIIFLLIKLIILRLIMKILKIYVTGIDLSTSKIWIALIIQPLCSSATTIISAMQTLKRLGYTNFKQKINTFLHVLVIWILISLIGIFLLYQYYIFLQRLKFLMKRNIYAVKKTYNKFYGKHVFECFQYCLYISVPFLIVFSNRASFFIVTSIIYMLLIFFYLKSFFGLHWYKRVMKGLLILVYLINHFLFLIMVLVQRLPPIDQLYYSFVCKISGLAVMWCVVIGCLLQIFDMLLDFVIWIIKNLIKIRRKCYNKVNNKQQKARILQIQAKEKRKRKYPSSILVPVIPLPNENKKSYKPKNKLKKKQNYNKTQLKTRWHILKIVTKNQ